MSVVSLEYVSILKALEAVSHLSTYLEALRRPSESTQWCNALHRMYLRFFRLSTHPYDQPSLKAFAACSLTCRHQRLAPRGEPQLHYTCRVQALATADIMRTRRNRCSIPSLVSRMHLHAP